MAAMGMQPVPAGNSSSAHQPLALGLDNNPSMQPLQTEPCTQAKQPAAFTTSFDTQSLHMDLPTTLAGPISLGLPPPANSYTQQATTHSTSSHGMQHSSSSSCSPSPQLANQQACSLPNNTFAAPRCSPLDCLNLRCNSSLQAGRCIYIQSGDPGDFDGYFIAAAGEVISHSTPDLEYVVVVPERRACPDPGEQDLQAHNQLFSEQVLLTAGVLVRMLCPHSNIVRGPLNQRNVIPLRFVLSEPERYSPLLADRPKADVSWQSIPDLARQIEDPKVTSVVLDVNGSLGYLRSLCDLGLTDLLINKIKASSIPITVMAGVLAEVETTTLRVPGRDPRATMNAIYHPDGISCLLDIAERGQIPLLFVTNNVCNQLLKFGNKDELITAFGLQGLLEKLATVWYGPHLDGKCVPFDWVSLTSMLLHRRCPHAIQIEQRELYVGQQDASVMVLKKPGVSTEEIVATNLANTRLWGLVESVVHVDRDAMLTLARHVAAHAEA